MNALLKIQKEHELECNVLLYEYLSLLKHLHPSTKEFDAILKMDMFLKPNKVAFQQVIYYLLKILAPNEIKKRVPSWPIYDNKREAQFRKEVVNYINDLTSIYPNAISTKVMVSHLITPGGPKFITVMLEIAQLVVREELKDEPGLMQPARPSNSNEQNDAMIQFYKCLTYNQSLENTQMIAKFEQVEKVWTEEMNSMKLLEKETKRNIEYYKQQLLDAADTGIKDMPSLDDLCLIENEVSKISFLADKCSHASNLIKYLCEGDRSIEYTSSDDEGDLNLLQYFTKMDHLTCAQIYDVCRVPEKKVAYTLHLLNDNINECTDYLKGCVPLKNEMQGFLNQLYVASASSTLQNSK